MGNRGSANVTKEKAPNGEVEMDNMMDQPEGGKEGAEGGKEGVQLQKSLTLVNGITVIVGSIVGSGIFVSPNGVLKDAGSVGLALFVWLGGGLFSLVGSWCFAELGCAIQRSGADYAYIFEAFGPLLAFLRLWVEVFIVRPCTIAIVALTFAYYVIEPLFPECEQPKLAVILLTALCITLLTAINCYNVQWAIRVQDLFTYGKMAALVLIIITGFVQLGRGKYEYFLDPFAGSTTNPGNIALAFYQGLFAYNGWNYLNCVIEELQEPAKNLPKAIVGAVSMVTAVYFFTNVAYFTTVSPADVLESKAVAVTFSVRLYGVMWWIMPVLVALSTFGGVNGILFTSARLFYVGAREGQMPQVLSMVQQTKLTPATAVFFTGVTSLIYLASTDMYKLINYVAFANWLAIGLSVVALLVFRYTRPNMERPIKVWLGWPIIYVAMSAFLVIIPLFASPVETGIGCLIIATGVPVYFICCVWKKKPKSFNNLIDSITRVTQKVVLVVPEDKKAE